MIRVPQTFWKKRTFLMIFRGQRQHISNRSTHLLILLIERTNRQSAVDIRLDKILRIIQTLDQNKIHGHGGISAGMLKTCGSSIIKPLRLLFNNCVRQEVFHNIWKMINRLPVHKKQ